MDARVLACRKTDAEVGNPRGRRGPSVQVSAVDERSSLTCRPQSEKIRPLAVAQIDGRCTRKQRQVSAACIGAMRGGQLQTSTSARRPRLRSPRWDGHARTRCAKTEWDSPRFARQTNSGEFRPSKTSKHKFAAQEQERERAFGRMVAVWRRAECVGAYGASADFDMSARAEGRVCGTRRRTRAERRHSKYIRPQLHTLYMTRAQTPCGGPLCPPAPAQPAPPSN